MLSNLTAPGVTTSAQVDERGASAVEYGLLITGIAALIAAIVFVFGGALNNIFDETCTSIATSATVAGC